jgi:hypothetical protein
VPKIVEPDTEELKLESSVKSICDPVCEDVGSSPVCDAFLVILQVF